MEALAPLHLAFWGGPFRRGAEHRPVHDTPAEQHAPARRFCALVEAYVSSLVGNLDKHAIIDVGTRGERSAVLHTVRARPPSRNGRERPPAMLAFWLDSLISNVDPSYVHLLTKFVIIFAHNDYGL